MSLFYQHAGITIHHGDCRFVIPTADPISVIVADPPYGDTSLRWDHKVEGWQAAMKHYAASMWVFGSFRFFFEASLDFEGWKLAQDLIWEKHNGSSFHADRFKRVHEHAVQFYQGEWKDIYRSPVMTSDATARTVRRKQRPPHTGNIEAGSYTSFDGGPRLMRSVIRVRSCHGEAEHPTQKPTGILDPLLRYSCRPGTAVLDPFMGSGSTLVAAKRLGLKAIGIDIDERNCETAVRRLAQEVMDFEETA